MWNRLNIPLVTPPSRIRYFCLVVSHETLKKHASRRTHLQHLCPIQPLQHCPHQSMSQMLHHQGASISTTTSVTAASTSASNPCTASDSSNIYASYNATTTISASIAIACSTTKTIWTAYPAEHQNTLLHGGRGQIDSSLRATTPTLWTAAAATVHGHEKQQMDLITTLLKNQPPAPTAPPLTPILATSTATKNSSPTEFNWRIKSAPHPHSPNVHT